MSAIFIAVLITMFMPIFNGENAFRAADKLFNTISKGSTYYIPMLKEGAAPYSDEKLDGTIKVQKGVSADDIAKVLRGAGADVEQAGDGLKVSARLGELFDAALKDSDDMFHNRGDVVEGRYGIPPKRALFAWWSGLVAITKLLESEKRFKEAAYIGELQARGVEVGYNYFKIEPEKASDRWLILTGSLIFYIIYTLWWGFAIYFLFEGIGLQLTAGKKKEL
jgi:hypothetical protein